MLPLYNRLSQENRDKLAEESKMYPSTISLLLIELKTTFYWIDMKLEYAFSLLRSLGLPTGNVYQIPNLFPPSEQADS